MGLDDADEAFRLERARARKLADMCPSGKEIDAEELRRVTEDGEPLRPEKPEPALGGAEGQSAGSGAAVTASTGTSGVIRKTVQPNSKFPVTSCLFFMHALCAHAQIYR